MKFLELNEFVALLLAMLAKNSRVIDLENPDVKTVLLPGNFKQIIECILCAENDWKERFSILIDTDSYFENHFAWELELSKSIKEFLESFQKTFEYDLLSDQIKIEFTESEVDDIIKRIPEETMCIELPETIRNTMTHFATLLVDLIYTRGFQESQHDYFASAVSYMRALEEEKIIGISSAKPQESFRQRVSKLIRTKTYHGKRLEEKKK